MDKGPSSTQRTRQNYLASYKHRQMTYMWSGCYLQGSIWAVTSRNM